MAAAEQWEPDDARVSCPVLRERGGAIPRATHLVMAFENFLDAKRVLAVLGKRLARYAIPPQELT
jgi:hypothetical protein